MSGGPKKQVRRDARQVADLAARLIDPLVRQRAGMNVELLAAWTEIAGEEWAALSRPERLDWPPRAEDDAFEPATLVIACETGRALFIQHQTDGLLRRINGHFGFTAVSRIRLIHKPLAAEPARRRKPPTCSGERARELERQLADIDDPALKAALLKLGKGVFSRRS